MYLPEADIMYHISHSIQDATRTAAANQAESEKIALYSSLSLEIDYELLTAEQILQTTDVRFLLHCWGVFVR